MTMPLQDHFHSPLKERRDWRSFYGAWAAFLAAELNQILPKAYFAEPNVQFGIQLDSALEETPLPASLSLPVTLLIDVVEVLVRSNKGRPLLAGAIELVSPSNKRGLAERAAFVSKCAGYVQEGAGLVIVDIVTAWRANLHEELLNILQTGTAPLPADLYAVAYRPVQRDGQKAVDVWQHALAVGSRLPAMPLGLHKEICMPVNLETTYDDTCRKLRITNDI
jgi:hypothetical protein